MRALITEEFHPILKDGLVRLGFQVDEMVDIEYGGVLEIISHYSILIVNSKIRIDENLLKLAPNLKIVGRIGSGQDIFDLDSCKRFGIEVLTSPEGNANAVAEHILAFLLSAMNHLTKSQEEMLRGEWKREENRGEELSNKTIGIIGFGHNGRRLSELLEGFQVKILAHDIRELEDLPDYVYPSSLERIQNEVDVCSIHLPLNADTSNCIDFAFLSRFQKPIYFINASRGKIVNLEDLVSALESGIIKKAMLDVFPEEPFQISEKIRMLVEQHRLFLTPHIAGWTVESRERLAEVMLKKIESTLQKTKNDLYEGHGNP